MKYLWAVDLFEALLMAAITGYEWSQSPARGAGYVVFAILWSLSCRRRGELELKESE